MIGNNQKESRLLTWLIVAGILRLLLACRPSGPIVPSNPPDASDSGILLNCEGACNTLKFFGCREGESPNCEPVLTAVTDQKLMRKPDGYPLACSDVALADSANAIRALGVSCNGLP
jgi:hypothetical protein